MFYIVSRSTCPVLCVSSSNEVYVIVNIVCHCLYMQYISTSIDMYSVYIWYTCIILSHGTYSTILQIYYRKSILNQLNNIVHLFIIRLQIYVIILVLVLDCRVFAFIFALHTICIVDVCVIL